ncbi:Ldh family oxidoreductase [Pelagibacterium nitratireducens]|jgi:L-2-hydroxycarboxylate dehydrogenase (NAD+)|uniref:Ldh family oxidoreductase n=1 Tax=Pelagibacterium nitratireducens TaxID=1046114 RepID=A0ABZ2HUZ0_9HYPH|tara:strand:+ start:4675 stop:5733 length:1059 start_codon:yes stop_codon:yes gene_type:complete
MNSAAPARTVDAQKLQTLVTDIFNAEGVPTPNAARIAECLVLADLRGVASHGVSRLSIYLERIRRGMVERVPEFAMSEPSPVAALLDGGNGFGFLAATKAMTMATERAEQFGIGMVGVKNSNHFGMAACYLLQAVDAGFAALVFTNASPAMPVWGGREPLLGTSPFAFGAPGNPPIILDMATSVVARGKIRRAAAAGEPIPEGWALDKDGNPTTDAQAGYEGLILPLGGPKGSGLSLMMEVMAGVMTGAAFGGEVRNQYERFDAPQNVGHMMVAFKPGIFMGEDYRERMGELVSRAKGSTPVYSDQPVLMPGEPEALRAEERRRNGILLGGADLEMIASEARSVGVDASAYI